MGLPERDPALDQQVGHIGGGQELVAGRGLQRLAAEADRLQHPTRGDQAQLECVHRVEQMLLVFLEVLVIGQRQAVHEAVQRDQVAGQTRRLGPQQLRRVRILLLGHDRGPRSPRVRQLAESKLLAGPQHELGAQPREVHGASGGRGQIVHDEITV